MRLSLPKTFLAVSFAIGLLLAVQCPAMATPLFTECPAIGYSDGCSFLITLMPDGTANVASDPSIIGYETDEDRVIGVLNESGRVVTDLQLSGSNIFNFDGDGAGTTGITCFGNPGPPPGPHPCGGDLPKPGTGPFGATGYEGPGTSFTVIDQNNGSVNFVGDLTPSRSAWFSLENSASGLNANGFTARDPTLIVGNPSKSLNALGNYTGIFSYQASSSSLATLQVQLTNTTDAAKGGFLTGFAFNNPNNQITGVSLTSDGSFQLIGGRRFDDKIKGGKFGRFDIGVSTGSAFVKAQKASKGIAVGQSESFVFTFTGTGLDALDESSFVSALSSGKGKHCCEFFLASFRDFTTGGGDVVPDDAILPNTDEPTTAAVPEPASIVLLAPVIFGLLAWRRKAQNLK